MVTKQLTDKYYEHTCQRPNCGHIWLSMLIRPKVCPACKSYVWDASR